MFKDAKVGDKVWHIRYGWMKILDIQRNVNYPIRVGFDMLVATFTFEGKVIAKDLNPSIFWDEIKFEIPKKPLPKLEVDTKVLVWNDKSECKTKRHFKSFDESGRIAVFGSGSSSWNNDGYIAIYDNWELYDETKDSK